MAEKGATGRRTRWIGWGFSPGKPCGSAATTAPAERPAPRSHKSVLRCMLDSSGSLVVRGHGARRRIEQELVVAIALLEVEHVLDRTGSGIEGTAAETLALQPVVFDEAHHGGLRDPVVADIVLLGVGRDHEERDARARTAAPVHRGAVEAVGLGASAA